MLQKLTEGFGGQGDDSSSVGKEMKCMTADMIQNTTLKLPICTSMYHKTNKISYHRFYAFSELYGTNTNAGLCTEPIYGSFE